MSYYSTIGKVLIICSIGDYIMNTLLAFILVANVASSVNPYKNFQDVQSLTKEEKEFVVDQEAKIKNSVPSIHDEIL